MAMAMIVQGEGHSLKPDSSSVMLQPATLQRIMNVVGDSKQNQEILRQVIGNVLSTYGQPVMTTILWHLRAKGVISNLGADMEMDIPMLHNALQQIAGDLTEMILNEICANLDGACHEHTRVHAELAA
jgi:hypothetical protein